MATTTTISSSSSSSFSSCKRLLPKVLLLILVFPVVTAEGLSPNYYRKTCPKVFGIVKNVMREAIAREPRLGASLLRLFFHDCFVNGCDGSLLLDDTPTFRGEKTAAPNMNSARGFNVVDDIKAALEKECPGVVSCADILAISSRDGVHLLGGPRWKVRLGRLDARTASAALANKSLPPPFFDLNNLVRSFNNVGLSEKDVVVLSGGHTIGLARCTTFRDHIYNDTNIDPVFAMNRQKTCPRETGDGDNNLAPLDTKSGRIFDNLYYKNLVQRRGLLHSDQELYGGTSTDSLVLKYSRHEKAFFHDFQKSMIKMGNIKPSSGTPLEVRRNCRKMN